MIERKITYKQLILKYFEYQGKPSHEKYCLDYIIKFLCQTAFNIFVVDNMMKTKVNLTNIFLR